MRNHSKGWPSVSQGYIKTWKEKSVYNLNFLDFCWERNGRKNKRRSSKEKVNWKLCK